MPEREWGVRFSVRRSRLVFASRFTDEQWGLVMLSREDVAAIRAEIERQEEALKECADGTTTHPAT